MNTNMNSSPTRTRTSTTDITSTGTSLHTRAVNPTRIATATSGFVTGIRTIPTLITSTLIEHRHLINAQMNREDHPQWLR